MLALGETRPSTADPTHDVEWNTMVDLKIVAHPTLDDAQKAAIERDYGMEKGMRVVQTRPLWRFI
jgi:hypothetical protein